MTDESSTILTGSRLSLSLRTRVETFKGSSLWNKIAVQDSFSPNESAVLICDMWDTHWCESATIRVNILAGRINALINVARQRGVQIIHSPSDTIEFYKNTPQRQAIANIASIDLPKPFNLPDPALPIDDSDRGCDTGECNHHKAWTRQHPTIEIADGDVISETGTEIYNLIHVLGIKKLFFTGVHTNMCVLDRSFGIKQMTRWGIDCVLVRDLTDSMYSPKRAPYVSHERGTELVVEHIEKHWCPTTTSADLAALMKNLGTPPTP